MTAEQIGFWVVAGLLDIPVFLFVGKLFFKDMDGFIEAVVFLFTPDILSAAGGDFWNDRFASLMLVIFLLICGGIGYWEYTLFVKWF